MADLYARMSAADENGDRRVLDLVEGDPAERFHPSIAAEFIEAPAETTRWSTKNGHVWTHHEPPAPVASPEPDPVPQRLIYPRFVALVKQAGGLDAETALSIIEGTHASAEVRLLRALLLEATGPLDRDDPMIQGGLQTLVDEAVLTEEGRAAILAAWPTA